MVAKATKVTKSKFNRFEKARLLGARALQLSMGAKPLVPVPESLDPIDIAALELEKGKIPLDVRHE
ncbi:MAG: DNA-directed RNA polymerase subunit K [Methanobacteriaceae archaeon]